MNVSIENPEVSFSQLKPGQCFIAAGSAYMKTDSPDWPAVALGTGTLFRGTDLSSFQVEVTPIYRVTLTRDVR